MDSRAKKIKEKRVCQLEVSLDALLCLCDPSCSKNKPHYSVFGAGANNHAVIELYSRT